MRRPRTETPCLDMERFSELVRHGEPVRRMAEILGVSDRTVTRYKRSYGLTHGTTGYRKLPDGWKERALSLFDEGYSQAAVSELTGVSVDALSRHLPGRGWTRTQRSVYARQVRILNQVTAAA